MTTHISHGLGLLIDVVTYPHTAYQHYRERRDREDHRLYLSVKERLWLSVYPREFFCDRPRWLWSFLLEAFA